MSGRRVWAMARKEWTQIRRDPRSLAVAILLPFVLLMVMGFGVDFDLKSLPFAFCDLDGSRQSRLLREALTQSDRFSLVASVPSPARGEELIRRGKCLFVIVVPPGMERDLAAGASPAVQVLLDGADSNTASVAKNYLDAALGTYSARALRDARENAGLSGTGAGLTVARKALYNPSLESRQFIVPGLIVLILVILGALLTSGTVVREKERGTFETLAASPVRPVEVLLGKLLPYVCIGMVDVAIAISTGALVFHVYIAGSLGLFLACSFVFLLAALAVGLFISTVAAREQVAMLLAIITTLLPAILLSGFAYPIRNMPLLLQAIARVIPATHFLIIIRNIYLKGVGLGVFWVHVVVLIIIAAGLFVLAAKRFRKQL